ncbi:IS1380 family transposase, partial [Escherichia coli]|nr:IS1380 family transposase [Escherichia coli]
TPRFAAARLPWFKFDSLKFDSLDSSEYRQQIKTFRLKYVFLAAKIIKTARYVIMKLSENYPYKGVYEKCLV